jgi:hypothetical protein
MRFLEFKSKYDLFKTGVLKNFLSKEFSKDDVEEYMKCYLEWKMLEYNKSDKAFAQ